MRVAYTAIFGGYDTLQPIKNEKGWRYLCFTDSNIEVKGWEIINIEPYQKAYRHIKTCPHLFLPKHEQSVWLDGNITPSVRMNHITRNKSGYWAMAHPQRRCIYKEAERCKELNKDNHHILDAQMERYKEEGYPENNGLVATGVLIRDGKGFEKFGDRWWIEIEKGSVRDQTSFNYVVWKTKIQYKCFPFLQNFKKVIHSGK